ncbi:MAG TPA: 1-(5-phosphoribosyl)-5-[(5-phosphoribosylamino)methylideneamino]imidazole-4-carboxamide isomerase [Candidatus Goldiibacteriota bacterium]|nr:1-(5-phosphoribosyl)-5-[(5-phosphoribosylamino)methylideneamino]imidazole-4-carboxamide isomerase [Candidatus Goldiibacteriota bacterium]HRQ43792.1 1-(5-phosphoribosyl)-5-[(5-phosphoribosylamino)methylideneamino]imidazole-4-carboxamide isomerase [Candidatus Goldiibacteriota bacterium]
MQIIPAIDLRKGKCVRLIMGDVRDETVYSKEPVAMAKLWQVKGARMIHVVDLDGAFSGRPKNMELIIKMIKALRAKVEVGGGIRTEKTIKKYIRAGARRVILSTSVIGSDKFLKKMVGKYGDKIVIGVDAKNGKVAAKGWKDITKIDALDFIKQLEAAGAKMIVYTDINRDGVLKGPNFKGVVNVLKNTKMKVIISGGITRMKNIERCIDLSKKYDNVEGVIIGKALYTGNIDLKEAVKLVKE